MNNKNHLIIFFLNGKETRNWTPQFRWILIQDFECYIITYARHMCTSHARFLFSNPTLGNSIHISANDMHGSFNCQQFPSSHGPWTTVDQLTQFIFTLIQKRVFLPVFFLFFFLDFLSWTQTGWVLLYFFIIFFLLFLEVVEIDEHVTGAECLSGSKMNSSKWI